MRELPLYSDPRLTVEREQPRDVYTGCKRCKLWKRARTVCMSAVGEPGGLLLVGEYPSQTEDRVGRPGIGNSGKYLTKQVEKHWSDPVAMDNAIRCYKGSEKLPSNSIDKCRGYLAQTLQEVKPTRIVCLGGAAMASMFGESLPVLSMRKAVAWLYNDDGTGTPNYIPVFLLPNPVNALRNRFIKNWFEEDLKWALTCEPSSLMSPPHDEVCYLIETVEDAEEAIEDCRERGGASYDVENAGKIGDEFLRLVSVALTPYGTDYGYVWTREALANEAVVDVLRRALNDPELPKSGSYLKHDHEVCMQALQTEIRGTDKDIRLQRKTLESHCSGRLEHMGYLVGMGGHKLEMEVAVAQACREINDGKKEAKKAIGFLPGTVDEIYAAAVTSSYVPKVYAYGLVADHDLTYRYNALDTVVTDRCRAHFTKAIENLPALNNVWTKVISGTVDSISQIEAWGVPVDVASIDTFRKYMQQRMDTVAKSFTQYNVNPGSNDEVADLLFEKLGLRCPNYTDTGKPQVDEDSLKIIENDHPIVGKLLDYRTVEKLKGTYADGLVKHVRDDGRIHPSIDAAGASSGRTSCKDPNLQNQPRVRDDEHAMARNSFAAPPGRMLVHIDYSQLEYRIAAMLSGDETMKQIFRDGKDVHQATAELIAEEYFKVAVAAVTKEMRSQAKTVNFAMLYGMAIFTIAKQLGVSQERAEEIKAMVMGQFKDLQPYIDSCIEEARRTGYTHTWWDGQEARRRCLYQIGNLSDDKKDRKSAGTAKNGAFNTRVQGTASEFCVASMNESVIWIREDDVDAKLVLPIHDALMFDVAEDAIDEVCTVVPEIMKSHDSQGVPIEVDIEVGKTWGTLKQYKVAA